jgi:hypothetical protein
MERVETIDTIVQAYKAQWNKHGRETSGMKKCRETIQLLLGHKIKFDGFTQTFTAY